MPAFLTHWRVLIETARHSEDVGNELGSLIIDAAALRRRAQGWPVPPQTTPGGAVWDTGPLPEIDFRFPGSDISAMAYVGALAPDIPYFQKGKLRAKISDDRLSRGTHPPLSANSDVAWADLLHTNRSGDVLLAFLEHIADIPSPALRSQALAFAMGYLSHIAADIALNPCINALAGAYQHRDIPGVFATLGQPWVQYIEPAARSLVAPTTLSTQVLDLLTLAAEVTYGFSEEQSKAFRLDYLAGLRGLRRYLAGRGIFRLLTLSTLLRNRKDQQITATIAEIHREPGTITFEEAIAYAVRLSQHLCRRGISYYAALRNTNASASERRQKRAALCDDLRNWNLETGYALDVTFDEEVTLHFLHNWAHFARLWDSEAGNVIQAHQSLVN